MRPNIFHRSTLYYSVLPMMIKPATDPEKVFREIEARLKRMGLVKTGDVVVFVFGYPIHAKNQTNTVRRWEVA
jgi:pyruvate kinase